MKYFPMGLDLRGRKCVVVGGGKIGARKVESLLRAGASVHLIAPEAAPGAAHLAEAGRIAWSKDVFRDEHLRGALLAVAATDDGALNARVVEAAKGLGILACDASSAERSDVIFGALHVAEGLTVAVFTDGEDPARARSTRDRISAFLGREGDPGPGSGD